jgi:hypothetical protein
MSATHSQTPTTLTAAASQFFAITGAKRQATRLGIRPPAEHSLNNAANALLAAVEASLDGVPRHFADEPLPSDPDTVQSLEHAVDRISQLAAELAQLLNAAELDGPEIARLIKELRSALDVQEKQVKATLTPPKNDLNRPAPIESAPIPQRRAITASCLTPVVGTAAAQKNSHLNISDAALYQRNFMRALIQRAEADLASLPPRPRDGRGFIL